MAEPLLELSIESLAAGGDGVGRDEGSRVVFVSYAAPGDRARVRVVEARKSFARAELVELLAPSVERVEPPCPYFRERSCGGCQWQHVSRAGQLAAKQAIVENALRRATARGLVVGMIQGGLEPATSGAKPNVEGGLVPTAPDYHWRRRARLHWIRRRHGERALIGFYAPRSDRVTDIDECIQLETALQRALAELRAQLAPALTGRGELLCVAGHRGEVHVAVRGPCAPAAAEALVGRAGIVGVALGRRRFGARDVELEPGLRGDATQFAQASHAGNQALLRVVGEACGALADKRVLEVFAGNGNLTRLLVAAGACEIVAVDDHATPALSPPHRSIRGDAQVVLTELAASERFDAVVLDPPRSGARELMPLVARLQPELIVYVSCDPATLGRDLDALADCGYHAEHAQPIDLMPQTAHVETVVTIRPPA